MFESWVKTLLESATVAAVLGGIAMFLFKSAITERLKNAIKAEYDEKLESHKAQLQASNSKEIEVLKAQLKGRADLELEQLKSTLQVQAAQRSLAFGKLHERRVEAIHQTYKLIRALQRAVGLYIAAFRLVGDDGEADRLNAVVAAHDALRDHIVANALFLTRSISAKVAALEAEFRRITNQFTLVVKAHGDQPNTSLWMKLLGDFDGTVSDAANSVEEEMRIALGDEPADHDSD